MNYKGKKGVDISSVNGDVDIQKIKDAGYLTLTRQRAKPNTLYVC